MKTYAVSRCPHCDDEPCFCGEREVVYRRAELLSDREVIALAPEHPEILDVLGVEIEEGPHGPDVVAREEGADHAAA